VNTTVRICRGFLVPWVATLALLLTHVAGAYTPPPYDQPPINYSSATPHDPIAGIQQRIAAGTLKLGGSDTDILRSLLAELHVPQASQVLVFSKTSLEASLISPANPRAIYFSDSTYIGYVPGGLIEAAGIDPDLGPVFYSLNPQDIRDGSRGFVREKTCMRCHGGEGTREIPEVFMRSVVADAGGEVLSEHEETVTTEATPFAERWGGWYVTGYTGPTDHRGNAFGATLPPPFSFTPNHDRPDQVLLKDSSPKYLVPTSDVVALLVLQHQVAVQNVLTRAGQRVRRAAMAENPVALELALSEGTSAIVDALLFRGAAPLPAGFVAHGAFRAAFESEGGAPDLRRLSLDGRLFAGTCSYMIGSAAFTGLPPLLRERVMQRLRSASGSSDAPSGRGD
jgi:hypothetical protein